LRFPQTPIATAAREKSEKRWRETERGCCGGRSAPCFEVGTVTGLTDGQLLERFGTRRGVESSPGVKDLAKVRALVDAATVAR